VDLTNIPQGEKALAMDSRADIPATSRLRVVLAVFAQLRFGFLYELL
jgi:hypothetical protein